MTEQHGRVVSINVSRGGVPKLPVESVQVTAAGLEGDAQRDLRHHGGPERAVCLFSQERIDALRAQGHPIAPGTTGENLTLAGIDWDAVVPGTTLRVGEVSMRITSYAPPCRTIRGSFADDDSNHISHKLHMGWSRVYARVTEAGAIRVGDAAHLLP